ncbi:hypothetical protein C2S53_007076 [Perilla frutescens var. hirtella]|uniref:Uncharacterized protein n=1 Tax=Perilla frutescens var. hirtella TaxID=608512 RepID=A0AAD4INN9_PERFH|nr:hypothetical protein C2S53_007076 [Perilla frutescens var. hirtella]
MNCDSSEQGRSTETDTTLEDSYLNSACDFDRDFHPVALFPKWSTSRMPYNPSSSKPCYLHSIALRYIHKFLAFTFSGCKDGANVLNKVEFFFLWCMKEKKKVNLECWLAEQFSNAQAKGRKLILGSLITHLAISLGVFTLENHHLHKACAMYLLDLDYLEVMGMISRVDGRITYPQILKPSRRRLYRSDVAQEDEDLHHSEASSSSTQRIEA